MGKELNLLLPNSLHMQLTKKSKERGVSLEALCFMLLENGSHTDEDNPFLDPKTYRMTPIGSLREELYKVQSCDMDKNEKTTRINLLQSAILKGMRR